MRLPGLSKTLLSLISLGLLAAGGLFAGRLSAGSFPDGSIEHSPLRMFGRLSRALDLSAEQKARVKTILKNHADEIDIQLAKSGAARLALHEAITREPMDETTIRARAADVGQAQADGAVLFARIRTEILPLLTEEQKQKLQAFSQKMRGRRERGRQAFADFIRSSS
jgi:Spy/CpxP family protein refolding chaperone